MKIEFDPVKEQKNVAKHGVSLATTNFFNFATARITVDNRADYGEIRYGALRYIGERLYALTFTKRGESVRAISLRKANEREEKKYHGKK